MILCCFLIISIQGMSCGGCAASVKRILEGQVSLVSLFFLTITSYQSIEHRINHKKKVEL